MFPSHEEESHRFQEDDDDDNDEDDDNDKDAELLLEKADDVVDDESGKLVDVVVEDFLVEFREFVDVV